MGGVSCKPVLPPEEVAKILRGAELKQIKRRFLLLCEKDESIHKDIFESQVIGDRLDKLGTAVRERALFMFRINQNPQKAVDFQEFLYTEYILHHSSKLERLRFVFNMLDFEGKGNLSQKQLKKALLFLTLPNSSEEERAKLQKQKGAMFDCVSLSILQAYDSFGLSSLSFDQWVNHCSSDDVVMGIVDQLGDSFAEFPLL